MKLKSIVLQNIIRWHVQATSTYDHDMLYDEMVTSQKPWDVILSEWETLSTSKFIEVNFHYYSPFHAYGKAMQRHNPGAGLDKRQTEEYREEWEALCEEARAIRVARGVATIKLGKVDRQFIRQEVRAGFSDRDVASCAATTGDSPDNQTMV